VNDGSQEVSIKITNDHDTVTVKIMGLAGTGRFPT
jgi:hypothetical protein